jgi:hypothetical protein
MWCLSLVVNSNAVHAKGKVNATQWQKIMEAGKSEAGLYVVSISGR